MDTDENQLKIDSPQEPRSLVFVRGFLVRFIFGAIPIGLIALIRSDLRSVMLLAFAWFFIVCMIGAALDVKFGRKVALDPRLLRLDTRKVALLILLIASFAYLYITR